MSDGFEENHLSDGEIQEFGTSNNIKAESQAEIKLITKSKAEFESRKKMRLYADEIVKPDFGKRLYADILTEEPRKVNDRSPIKRRLELLTFN